MDPLERDPMMAELLARHGPLELEPAADPFGRLVVSIINQQLSTASAAAIRERVFDRFEVTPTGLLDADETALREAGLSRQKTEYVRNVAAAFSERDFSHGAFDDMTDEGVIETLTEIRGIGVWTAKMFCIFVLAREDVFPVEDLGIRRGMAALYGLEDRPAMVEKAEAWRPYRSYASRYLWRATD